MMILTRGRATQSLEAKDYAVAIAQIEEGIENIREFYREHSRMEAGEQSGELYSLQTWLGEIRANRPLSPREKLEQALNDAVQREDYEKAAKVRDALKNLKPEQEKTKE